MTFSKDNLRLHLTFFNEMKQIQVLGARSRFGVSLCNLGLVTSKAALQGLMEAASVDHYLVCSGDLMPGGTFEVKYYQFTPKSIVEALERGFQRAGEIELKMLEGGELTAEEKSFAVPNTLWLYSSSLETEEGLRRAHDWFQTPRVDARAFRRASAAH